LARNPPAIRERVVRASVQTRRGKGPPVIAGTLLDLKQDVLERMIWRYVTGDGDRLPGVSRGAVRVKADQCSDALTNGTAMVAARPAHEPAAIGVDDPYLTGELVKPEGIRGGGSECRELPGRVEPAIQPDRLVGDITAPQ